MLKNRDTTQPKKDMKSCFFHCSFTFGHAYREAISTIPWILCSVSSPLCPHALVPPAKDHPHFAPEALPYFSSSGQKNRGDFGIEIVHELGNKNRDKNRDDKLGEKLGREIGTRNWDEKLRREIVARDCDEKSRGLSLVATSTPRPLSLFQKLC